ncbi:MAG: hypothetical protein K2Y27_05800 [Xanthobacteraceae bacterium]|nr:hypothetical protein [Xanthobacteraceae bacterium]
MPANEAIQVSKTATDLLSSSFRLVPAKSEANYFIQIRVDRLTNYAIRNPKRQPSRGQVMISLCRLPIADAGTDCGNLTFFSFSAFQGAEALRKAFPIWISMTLQRSR